MLININDYLICTLPKHLIWVHYYILYTQREDCKVPVYTNQSQLLTENDTTMSDQSRSLLHDKWHHTDHEGHRTDQSCFLLDHEGHRTDQSCFLLDHEGHRTDQSCFLLDHEGHRTDQSGASTQEESGDVCVPSEGDADHGPVSGSVLAGQPQEQGPQGRPVWGSEFTCVILK